MSRPLPIGVDRADVTLYRKVQARLTNRRIHRAKGNTILGLVADEPEVPQCTAWSSLGTVFLVADGPVEAHYLALSNRTVKNAPCLWKMLDDFYALAGADIVLRDVPGGTEARVKMGDGEWVQVGEVWPQAAPAILRACLAVLFGEKGPRA